MKSVSETVAQELFPSNHTTNMSEDLNVENICSLWNCQVNTKIFSLERCLSLKARVHPANRLITHSPIYIQLHRQILNTIQNLTREYFRFQSEMLNNMNETSERLKMVGKQRLDILSPEYNSSMQEMIRFSAELKLREKLIHEIKDRLVLLTDIIRYFDRNSESHVNNNNNNNN